jgi:hypothetical protein
MSLQVTCLGKRLITKRTAEESLTSVNSEMILQVTWQSKCRVTKRTTEGFLSSVNSNMDLQGMSLQVTTIGKPLWTFRAFVGFLDTGNFY